MDAHGHWSCHYSIGRVHGKKLCLISYDSYLTATSHFHTRKIVNRATRHKTCVSKVEPQRPMLNKKMSSPSGSPISSAKRWNVDRGTTIRRRQNLVWASRINAPNSLRQRCIPVKQHNWYNTAQVISPTTNILSCVHSLVQLGYAVQYLEHRRENVEESNNNVKNGKTWKKIKKSLTQTSYYPKEWWP